MSKDLYRKKRRQIKKCQAVGVVVTPLPGTEKYKDLGQFSYIEEDLKNFDYNSWVGTAVAIQKK